MQELQEDDIDAAFGEDGEEDAELDDENNDNNEDQNENDVGDGGEEGDVEDNPDEAAEGMCCFCWIASILSVDVTRIWLLIYSINLFVNR